MGNFLWRKPPLEKQLEKIDEQIKSLKQRNKNLKQYRKNALFISSVFWFIAFILYLLVFYFYLLDPFLEWQDKLLYASPIIGIPILTYSFFKILNSWYLGRISRTDKKVIELTKLQKEKIEEFKEAMNFERASKLIDRLSKTLKDEDSPVSKTPKALDPASSARTPSVHSTQNQIPSGLHQRRSFESPFLPPSSSNTFQSPTEHPETLLTPQSNLLSSSPFSPIMSSTPFSPFMPSTPVPKVQMILQDGLQSTEEKKNWYEKGLDLLVGDSPSSSCTVICGNCNTVYGVFPKEECDDMNFLCKSCKCLNLPNKKLNQTKEATTSENNENKN